MRRLAVLVSGGGTNLQALIDDGIDISLVISSKRDAFAVERAAKNGIPVEIFEWAAFKPDRIGYSRRILEALKSNEIEIVVAAGFMVILDDCLCRAYPRGMVNVHPSLIPAFSGEGFYGLKVHEAALARGVKLTGATVHFVNEICDGGEIIAQKAVPVFDGDTPETLQSRVMKAEREILPQAVRELAAQKRTSKSARSDDILSIDTGYESK
jgi:phosphoribosylglycinamide formyltransferase-1